LEAVTDGQSSFAGWSGACSGKAACELAPGTDVSVAATFLPATPRHLQISLNGAGGVRSDPAGIDCPRVCAADFPQGTEVHLQPSAPAGWDFTGFGGACNGPACTITLASDVSAWATFLQRPVTVSVQLSGNGSVASSPAGIDCPRVCSAIFPAGIDLALAATPATGFSFNSFAGACSGASCSLRLATDARVIAAFQELPAFKLVVVQGGDGHGRVTSAPAGIDCPGTCTATFFQGTTVTLSASPDPLSKVVRYDGSCSGAQCALTLKGDAAVSVEFAQRRYRATDLGAPSGGSWSDAIGISLHATLVAGAWGGVQQIFFWDGSMHDIGVATGNPSAVNDDGTVVGAAWIADQWHAFRWDSGKTTDLANLGGAIGWATGVNNAGVVVGWSARADGVVRATSWTTKGPVDLGSLGDPWNGCSYAHAINSSGVAVGESCTATSGTHAARFRAPDAIDDLGSLGGYARAQAINDAGMIVGYSDTASGFHAFVYADGKMIDAGTIPGAPQSDLVAVNGAGVAVGYVFTSSGPQRGVVYAAGRMMDINTLVDGTLYTITMATGIDEAGNIVVQAQDHGYRRALLLRPQ
jgi:probable HAF family extracellular repeat protein